MRLAETAEQADFRAELVAWLEAHAPAPEIRAEPRQSSADMPVWAREWQRTLFDAGYLVPGWPPELGGRNASAAEQMIYFDEMSKRQIPRSANPQGLGIIAPSILDYGTDDQKEQFLLPTLRAEIAWSLGMSEPNAGSDLASLSTRAVLDGDEFVINGQKVWTSGAHHSDWCLCFVRTNTDVPKHKGITAIIVDMKTPGVETRPFAELSEPDYTDFNEVFFTDVRVPKVNVLGEVDKGWPITQGSLAHERAMLWISSAYDVRKVVDALVALGDELGADGRPLKQDPRFRNDVASFYVDAQALMLIGYRGFSKFMAGKSNPEHSLLKLYGGETVQKSLLCGTEWLGLRALDHDVTGPNMQRNGSWATQWIRSFSNTIPGGTSEIQRNIIAERVLGLPRA